MTFSTVYKRYNFFFHECNIQSANVGGLFWKRSPPFVFLQEKVKYSWLRKSIAELFVIFAPNF